VQHRNAALAIIPAGSIAVLGWLIAGTALLVVAVIARRIEEQAINDQAAQDQEDAINLSSQSSS
jgi:hypothetical protein